MKTTLRGRNAGEKVEVQKVATAAKRGPKRRAFILLPLMALVVIVSTSLPTAAGLPETQEAVIFYSPG